MKKNNNTLFLGKKMTQSCALMLRKRIFIVKSPHTNDNIP